MDSFISPTPSFPPPPHPQELLSPFSLSSRCQNAIKQMILKPNAHPFRTKKNACAVRTSPKKTHGNKESPLCRQTRTFKEPFLQKAKRFHPKISAARRTVVFSRLSRPSACTDSRQKQSKYDFCSKLEKAITRRASLRFR